ncbi:hypothetical protein [Pseudomonas syringae]|uniref:hypothetical protein n=1 Tax=Pseudomonas syringae TaxID=317 RepID=UPI0009B52A30|nr:hypothetical protein [Pseudomonas syringae]MBI6707065.1 hypothetical protein [Pseudomonas syringae]MBI6819606.1 hypothetical protein [Pseudomonas syringae]MBI6824599.1 hypothetical protein [Pseudomonas syringae]UZS74116.1 hypothetical protein OQB66_07300 [Pseudomonas syringae]
MESYPLDDNSQGQRIRQVGLAIGLTADEVELWVTAIEEDGSGMGYVVHFSKRTPPKVLAKVHGVGG